MMGSVASILGKRYARAFLNCYPDSLTSNDLEGLYTFERLVKEDKLITIFFRFFRIDIQMKKKHMQAVGERFEWYKKLLPLIDLLIQHNRLWLLSSVVREIRFFYMRDHAIISLTIRSSCELNKEELHYFVSSMEQMTGCTIMYTQKIEPSLIAGVRIEGDSYLWEHSIAQKLRALRLKCKV